MAVAPPRQYYGMNAIPGFSLVPKIPTPRGALPRSQRPADGTWPGQSYRWFSSHYPPGRSFSYHLGRRTAAMCRVSFLSVAARQLGAHFGLSHESRSPGRALPLHPARGSLILMVPLCPRFCWERRWSLGLPFGSGLAGDSAPSADFRVIVPCQEVTYPLGASPPSQERTWTLFPDRGT